MIRSAFRKLFAFNQPLVSVIVANYNNAVYLEQCLDSILLQTYKNLQIVICDDDSSDHSRELLSRYAKNHETIKVILNEKNLGVSTSRDRAIQHADGEYITTLDSDDYLISDDKIAAEMKCLKVNRQHSKKGVIAFSNVIVVNEDGDFIGNYLGNKIREGMLFNDIISRNCMIPRDFLFTKEMYKSIGGYDLSRNLYEDWELKIKLAKKYPFYFSGIKGIAYRRKGHGLSYQSRDKHYAALSDIFNKHKDAIKDDREQVMMLFNKHLEKINK